MASEVDTRPPGPGKSWTKLNWLKEGRPGSLQICTRLCKSTRGSACKQTSVQVCMWPMHVCSAPSLFAERRVHLQKRVHMCTAICSFACGSARMHNAVLICSRLCTCAGGLVICTRVCKCLQSRAYLQPAVYICRASCLFARACGCVQTLVFICTSTCTHAGFLCRSENSGSRSRGEQLLYD